ETITSHFEFMNELIGSGIRPSHSIQIDRIFFPLEVSAAHLGACETGGLRGIEQNLGDENLIALGVMLDARCSIHHIAKYVAVLDEAVSEMQPNPHPDLIDFVALFAVFFQRALHGNGCPYRRNLIVKLGENGIPDGLYDATPLRPDHREQE